MDYNTTMTKQELLMIAEEIQKDANEHYQFWQVGNYLPKINYLAFIAKSKIADDLKLQADLDWMTNEY